MKQIRITTEAGEQVHPLVKGSMPQMITGHLVAEVHEGGGTGAIGTLRLPIGSVLGYVVEDAKKPTKLDALAAALEQAGSDVDRAAECVRVEGLSDGALTDETKFRASLNAYVHACDARESALEAFKAGAKAAKRAKDAAADRKAAKANGTAPTPKAKKPAAKKAAKK